MKHRVTNSNARHLAAATAALLALAGTNTGTIPLRAQSNATSATQPANPDLVRQLLERIEALERKSEEQSRAAKKAHDEEIRDFQKRIQDLEAKVKSVENAKVLPEIAVTPGDGPTLQELDQRIRVAERKSELAAEAAEAKAKEAPKISLGQNGFAFSSADTNFVVKIRGLLQLDSRTFIDDHPLARGNDSFVLRRARPILEGTVFHDFDYLFVPDFAGTTPQIFDASLNYRFKPELQVKVGKFKNPLGLEALQSDATLPFNERSLVTSLLPSRGVGVQLWGELGPQSLSYALGVFNGSGDGRVAGNTDFGDDKEFEGRIFAHPFRQWPVAGLENLGIGLAGSYSQVTTNAAGLPNTTGGTLPGYFTEGQQQFFAYNPAVGTIVGNGDHWRLTPQAYYYYGPFGLLGEYVISDQQVLNTTTLKSAELQHTGWQVSGQWVLTGESASYNGITPKRAFNPAAGGWGAWQLVARYGKLSIDDGAFQGFSNPDTSASEATSWSTGVNWWLNKNVRVLASFTHTDFGGGGAVNPAIPATTVPPATATHQDENIFFSRIQLSF